MVTFLLETFLRQALSEAPDIPEGEEAQMPAKAYLNMLSSGGSARLRNAWKTFAGHLAELSFPSYATQSQ